MLIPATIIQIASVNPSTNPPTNLNKIAKTLKTNPATARDVGKSPEPTLLFCIKYEPSAKINQTATSKSLINNPLVTSLT